MTRKHFELIARVVANIGDPIARQSIARHFAQELQNQNPRFDTARFIAACKAEYANQ